MMSVTYNTTIRLRKDTEANFNTVKDTFIPADGEICIVDTTAGEMRFKVGNGTSTFAQIEYVDKNWYVIRGYYFNENFYYDSTYTTLIPTTFALYFDKTTKKTYIYEDGAYVTSDVDIPSATDTVAGIMKLYKTTGTNEDGTMTQKIICEEIAQKFEVSVSEEGILDFSNGI